MLKLLRRKWIWTKLSRKCSRSRTLSKKSKQKKTGAWGVRPLCGMKLSTDYALGQLLYCSIIHELFISFPHAFIQSRYPIRAMPRWMMPWLSQAKIVLGMSDPLGECGYTTFHVSIGLPIGGVSLYCSNLLRYCPAISAFNKCKYITEFI